ncbi:MAG TPA: Nramp family divalent metal transporter, partial [Chthonomonadaceae bacterium]|nr:Nramp family divalent metal transporter [Chthonomonadaceae bacterium]
MTTGEAGLKEGKSLTLPSLPEVYRSVRLPVKAGWLRRFLAFAGPGYMVSVGYMDPGNWATDLAGGSKFGYKLLWVILASNLMAILLQTLCARLGLVTGRDLAQACRDYYKKPAAIALWLLCEVAIIACDLAEVIGSAVALNL